MREAVRRRLTVERPQLLTPLPRLSVGGQEFLFPAFLNGELGSTGAGSSAAAASAWPASKFELQRERKRPTAGCSTEARTFAPPTRLLVFAARDLLAQLVSLGERAGSAAGAAVSRSWLTHKTVLISSN